MTIMAFTKTAGLGDHGQHEAVHAVTDFRTRLQTGFARFVAERAERRRIAREASTLLRFSDRELWDIGISRGDIPAVMDGSFHRD